jgi:hypothetical protein
MINIPPSLEPVLLTSFAGRANATLNIGDYTVKTVLQSQILVAGIEVRLNIVARFGPAWRLSS